MPQLRSSVARLPPFLRRYGKHPIPPQGHLWASWCSYVPAKAVQGNERSNVRLHRDGRGYLTGCRSNILCLYLIIVDLSAAAAAFFGTTVHQVSLRQTVSNHRSKKYFNAVMSWHGISLKAVGNFFLGKFSLTDIQNYEFWTKLKFWTLMFFFSRIL